MLLWCTLSYSLFFSPLVRGRSICCQRRRERLDGPGRMWSALVERIRVSSLFAFILGFCSESSLGVSSSSRRPPNRWSRVAGRARWSGRATWGKSGFDLQSMSLLKKRLPSSSRGYFPNTDEHFMMWTTRSSTPCYHGPFLGRNDLPTEDFLSGDIDCMGLMGVGDGRVGLAASSFKIWEIEMTSP